MVNHSFTTRFYWKFSTLFFSDDYNIFLATFIYASRSPNGDFRIKLSFYDLNLLRAVKITTCCTHTDIDGRRIQLTM